MINAKTLRNVEASSLFSAPTVEGSTKTGQGHFQNWKFYGERGLGKAPVTIWVYEGSLTVEHQAVTLSKYSVQVQDDHKHLQTVSHPRLSQTPFRSPQLALFDLGPGDWLLYWKTPEYAPVPRRRRIPGIIQLPLFEVPFLDMAVGADTRSGGAHPWVHLHLLGKPDALLDADT